MYNTELLQLAPWWHEVYTHVSCPVVGLQSQLEGSPMLPGIHHTIRQPHRQTWHSGQSKALGTLNKGNS